MNYTPSGAVEDRLSRLEAAFALAAEATGPDRSAVLDSLDPDIRIEVGKLLALVGPAAEALEHPQWDLGSKGAARIRLPAGTKAGPFTIVDEIGRGGMGVVYRAKQHAPEREVAVKALACPFPSDASVKRFMQESRALARLQHPGIATILETGVIEDAGGSIPFFAMELIPGLPLTRFADERRLDARAGIELIMQVCEAVEHAHQRGVIHRDLKPANVLVDADGRARVLDFGIARLLDEDLRTSVTASGMHQLAGTLAYMSPEQIAAAPHAADTRTDVYALGVMLYELLTGRLPLGSPGESALRMLQAVKDEEPAPMSRWKRELKGDAEWIAARALAKDPDQRYQSAGALREDLQRFLRHEPLPIRRASARYVLGRFVRRNRVLSAATIAAAAALCIGGVTTMVALRRTVAAERLAVTRLEESRKLARSLLFEIPRQLSSVPGSMAVRLQVVRQALDSLSVLTAGSDDADMLSELALASVQLGSLTGAPDAPSARDYPEAMKLVEAGVSLAERAAALNPTFTVRRRLGVAYSVRASLAETKEERLAIRDRGIEQLRSALACCPDPPGGERCADTTEKLAYELARAGSDARALALPDTRLEEAMRLMENLIRAKPDNQGLKLTHAMMVRAVADSLEETDPIRPAALWRDAIRVFRETLKLDPKQYSAVHHLLAATAGHARVAARRGNGEEAISLIDSAAAEFEPMMLADPDNSLQRDDWLEQLNWRAEVRVLAATAPGAQEHAPLWAAQARSLIEQAIATAKEWHADTPDSPQQQGRLERFQTTLSRVKNLEATSASPR